MFLSVSVKLVGACMSILYERHTNHRQQVGSD